MGGEERADVSKVTFHSEVEKRVWAGEEGLNETRVEGVEKRRGRQAVRVRLM